MDVKVIHLFLYMVSQMTKTIDLKRFHQIHLFDKNSKKMSIINPIGFLSFLIK